MIELFEFVPGHEESTPHCPQCLLNWLIYAPVIGTFKYEGETIPINDETYIDLDLACETCMHPIVWWQLLVVEHTFAKVASRCHTDPRS